MKIGNRTVLLTVTLLLMDGEDAEVDVPAPNWSPRFVIAMKYDADATAQPRVEVGTKDQQTGSLDFFNFRAETPLASTEPIAVANAASGERITLVVWHERAGSVHRLDLQFLVGS